MFIQIERDTYMVLMNCFRIKDPFFHAISGVTKTTLKISEADDISLQMITQVKNRTNHNMIWMKGKICGDVTHLE